jgi:hypothetical protein
MHADWNMEQLLGYLGTWSAIKEYKQLRGQDPRELIYEELQSAWGEVEQPRRISWPLTLLVGSIAG